MADIFISYAHLDNRRIDAVQHEVPNAIDHFIALYSYELGIAEERLPERFFRDHWSIDAGQLIPERVQRAIDECPVMLAFYSPNYFVSQMCLLEWLAFRKALARAGKDDDGNDRKLLIPIEVKPVDPAKIEKIDPRWDEWHEDLVLATGRKRIIFSKDLLARRDTQPLADRIRELAEVVDAHIARQQGTSLDRVSSPNVIRVQAPIVGGSLQSSPEITAQIRRESARLRYNKIPPVCVIYAGGTVGMIRTADSDPTHADYEMAQEIDAVVQPLSAQLSALPFNMHFFRLAAPIDSSNVTADKWVDLAKLVEEQMHNYQGFVVLHGTNTLAYTASALAYLLNESLCKPVVLTGSEVPLSDRNTDALHNVENAIRATAHQAYGGPILIPEVCVYWNNLLHRGSRVTKKYASDRSSSFHTPNMAAPLATLANDKLDVEYAHVNQVPKPSGRHSIVDISSPEVAILFIHPDMEFDRIDARFEHCPDGLILLSYGPGNVPEDPRFIAMIERLIGGGTVVANITQCPFGKVELKLFETSAKLFDLGVIDGYDMTLEAAYTKLLWALASFPGESPRQRGVQDAIKAKFQENTTGEMSASVFTVHWPAASFTAPRHSAYRVSDTGDFKNKFSSLDVAATFIRIEGLRFPPEIKKANVRIYFGGPPATKDDDTSDDLLASFDKALTQGELQKGSDKNLVVTPDFRKCFTNEEFVIAVGLHDTFGAEIPGIEFKSIRMVVYTKGTRRRDSW